MSEESGDNPTPAIGTTGVVGVKVSNEIWLDLNQIERDTDECRDAWEEQRWMGVAAYLRTIARQAHSSVAKIEAAIGKAPTDTVSHGADVPETGFGNMD